MRGEGRGERLSQVDLPDIKGTPVLLVNPGKPLPTADVYAAWDGADRGPLGEDWRAGRNDLQPAAIARIPEIADVLDALGDAELARMSGSGPTCFGLYADEAARDAVAERLSGARPDWWVLPTRLRR
jgi:4-diphosphocytidyl-2-C-methyl-D-erythritol kinase